MRQFKILGTALASALLVAACGGGGDSVLLTGVAPLPAKGTLAANSPVPILAMTADVFTKKLATGSTASQGLLAVASSGTNVLPCGVDVRYMQYGTVGGAAVPEATDASGVIMIPTGGEGCTGPRPIVLYAHGTTTAKDYNLADVTNPNNPAAGESGLLMAMYAAQGFIVVAPNYAGYDTSRLSYHPYLNATQSATEMMDALAAARSYLKTSASDKLFIAGYSQGGHVAMATHRAMQAANFTVTASAPMSGPYALGAFMDAIFGVQVPIGATLFGPLTINSYQKAYGNIYSSLSEIYETAYATGMDTLLPSTTPYTTLFAQGKLPSTELFYSATAYSPATASSPAVGVFGYGPNNLVNQTTRNNYLTDAGLNRDRGFAPAITSGNPLRQAVIANDLRDWTPNRFVLLCGGVGDPTVFYPANTSVMASIWTGNPYVTTLNVDATPAGTYAAVQGGFRSAYDATVAAAGGGAAGALAATMAYHGSLVPPFCNLAAQNFFKGILARNL